MTDAPQDTASTGPGSDTGAASAAAASAAAGRRLRDDFAPRSGQGIAGQVVHSRRGFVRFMKFVLPVGAVALVGLIAAWPQLTKRDTGFRLAFSSIETQEMALVMNNPRFRGNDSNGQPYIVTADRAMQDPNDSKLVTLDKISADITLNDGAWISLTSNTGVYNNTARILTLHGDINVFSDRGYEFHGINAEIDLNTGVLASDDKVWGHASLGSIRANGMRVYDRGKTIVFINGVKTTLNPRGAG